MQSSQFLTTDQALVFALSNRLPIMQMSPRSAAAELSQPNFRLVLFRLSVFKSFSHTQFI